jgi:glycine cleavage system H protein
MNALRRLLNGLLVLTGSLGLALIAIPILATGAFLLRAAFLFLLPAAVVAGVALWFGSMRFRAWCRTFVGTVETYKGLRLAMDVDLDRHHAWARAWGDHVTVGADNLLTAALGPVDRVELPQPGRQVQRGEVLFRLHRGDRVLDVRAPVAGTVVAGNHALANEPGLVNDDPFQRGWAVKLEVEPHETPDRQGLRRGQDALAWFRTEVDRLIATVLGNVGPAPAMADGGLLAGDFYKAIDTTTWQRINDTF